MIRRAGILAALWLVPAWAIGQTSPAATTAPAAAPIAALQQALAHNEQAGGSFGAREAALAPVIDRAFNIQALLRAAVGLSYATIPSDKQAALLKVFREFTVASYVSNFSGPGDRFTISPQTRQAGADTVVQTGITSSSGTTTRVDYVLRPGLSGPQVVDVLLDGTISRVAVERSDFRSVLDNGGVDGLIRSLSQKVSALSGGGS